MTREIRKLHPLVMRSAEKKIKEVCIVGAVWGGLLCLRHSQGRPPRGDGICVDSKEECSKQKALREKPLRLKIIFFSCGIPW